MKKILLTVVLVAALLGTASAREHKKPSNAGEKVPWKNVPAAAQTAIQTNAAGGKVVEVDRETKKGIVFYRAEVKAPGGKWLKVAVTESGQLVKVKEDANGRRKHRALFGG